MAGKKFFSIKWCLELCGFFRAVAALRESARIKIGSGDFMEYKIDI